MPRVAMYNQMGEKVGQVVLSPRVYGIEPNEQAMFDAVLVAQANKRQDTSKTKKRDEVSGGGKKPWRQKGTGRARQGSTRSPQWRHGGIVFGPTGDQNHTIKMNKKVRALALKSILSKKLADKELIVVDQFNFEEPKTKNMVASLQALNSTGKTLIVMSEETMNDNAILSALNIPNVGILYFFEINVYDIMNCEKLVITKQATKFIEEVLEDGKEG